MSKKLRLSRKYWHMRQQAVARSREKRCHFQEWLRPGNARPLLLDASLFLFHDEK
jgi:hypothetical protein